MDSVTPAQGASAVLERLGDFAMPGQPRVDRTRQRFVSLQDGGAQLLVRWRDADVNHATSEQQLSFNPWFYKFPQHASFRNAFVDQIIDACLLMNLNTVELAADVLANLEWTVSNHE